MSTLAPGKLVYWKGQPVVILELKGFSEAIVRDINTGSTDIVRVAELTINLESLNNHSQGRHLVAEDKEWSLALERFEIIKPLLDKHARTESDVRKVASEHGKGCNSLSMDKTL